MNGTDILVNVETAVPGTYAAVGSQRGCRITETTEAIDESTKDSRGYVGSAGRYSCTIECDALYVSDDAAYLLLQTAMRDGDNIKVELSDAGVDTENIDAICTNLSQDFPDQGAGLVSASFQCSGDWAAAS
jgi:predicted secreted protein